MMPKRKPEWMEKMSLPEILTLSYVFAALERGREAPFNSVSLHPTEPKLVVSLGETPETVLHVTIVQAETV